MVALDIPGHGLPYRFELYYRSRVNFRGPLGHSWEFSLNKRLVVHPDDSSKIIYYDGKGRGDGFQALSDGSYLAPEGQYKKLVKEESGEFLLRSANGTIYRFFPLDDTPQAGKLKAMITRCGNRVTLEYDSKGLLVRVLDTLSRPIEHFYDSRDRLVRIKDFADREVIFTYNQLDQLIGIRGPVVVGTVSGNDFPEGKTWKFSYSQGFSEPYLNNNLLTVTAPNEVASNGEASLVNTYDSEDRLTTQMWGGTNYSGIAAGGTISYSREEVNEGVEPGNLDVVRSKTTIVDRNGNTTLFYFNKNGQLLSKEEKTRGIRPGDPASFVVHYRYTAAGMLREEISPEGTRVVYEYDEANADVFQRGNLLSETHYPDPERGGVQQFRKVTYRREPVYNRLLEVVEERGNDESFEPQNGGSVSEWRYRTEYLPDYFEGTLDSSDCLCGFTLRQLVERFDIDISPVLSRLNQGDLNGDGVIGQLCGNTVMIRYPPVKLRDGSQQQAVEGTTSQIIEIRMSYNRFGQLNFIETPEGEITKYSYYGEADPDGDGEDVRSGTNNAGRPFDSFAGGYPKEMIADFAHSERYRGTKEPAALRTRYGYDRVGNTTSVIDSRGVKSEYEVNSLNQIVEIRRASDVSEATETHLTAFSYRMRLAYDYNNNVVKTEVEYKDGNNPDLPEFIATFTQYDILDKVIEITQTVSTAETVTMQFRYDANENLTEIISPLAVANIEPENRRELVYDERDLIYRSVTAPGSAGEREISCRYNLDGMLTAVTDGEDNNGDGQPEVSEYFYDGFNRLVRTVSAEGSETRLTYDPASNLVKSENYGLPHGPGRNSKLTSGNVLLGRRHYLYDEMSRQYEEDIELFMPDGVTTVRPVALSDHDHIPGDGKVTGFVDYDRNSRIAFATAVSPTQAPEISRFYYDGLGRTIRVVDAAQNERRMEYDANSNLVRYTTIERDNSRVPEESFTAHYVYDALNRPIRITDHIGQTRRLYYDSRDLAIKMTDAQGPIISDPLGVYPGSINGDGNAVHFVHDGLTRMLFSRQELTAEGEGGNPVDLTNPANPDGLITASSTWDKNSRLAAVSDDKGNVTTYYYDVLNRPVRTMYADGCSVSTVYDRDHNAVAIMDQNGTVVRPHYDGINRVVRIELERAEGLVGTTVQSFEYDGLSRLTKAFDNNEPGNTEDDSEVTRAYDSLGRWVEESQNGRVISSSWAEDDDMTAMVYPNGRELRYMSDILDRTTAISDREGNFIARYDYLGSRLLERTYRNGTRLTMLDSTGTATEGYDAMGRLTQLKHVKDGYTLLAGFAYGYNRENHRTYSENLLRPELSEVYKYDSSYRLSDFKRGTLNAEKDDTTGVTSQSQSWQLDGSGNWSTTTVEGAVKTQSVSVMNEYTSFDGVPQTFDQNGNLTDDGERLFFYDALDRLREVRLKTDNALIARYTYDALGRRTSKSFLRTHEEPGPGDESEYETDADTIGLWHFNETCGVVLDSSGNDNHGRAPRKIERGVDGLWDTNAVEFEGAPIRVEKSQSLNSIGEKLTVETWVYVKTPECKDKKHKSHHKNGKCSQCAKHWVGGTVIHRPASYRLRILRKDQKVAFTLYTRQDRGKEEVRGEEGEDRDDDEDDDHPCCRKHPKCGHKLRKIRIESDGALPADTWVHLAAVYDGSKVVLLVNGFKQADEKAITGTVRSPNTPLFLGGVGFRGKLEEARISSAARTTFGGGDGGPITVRETVLRNFYWAGWGLVEERERIIPEGGQPGEEKVLRQFVDGVLGLDEHICQDIYDETGSAIVRTVFYHANVRGDTVALTDSSGNLLLDAVYSPYGQIFQVTEQGEIAPLADTMLLTYGFQGAYIDEETGLYYLRHRQYHPGQGRFLQRDPLGGMNPYEFGNSSPVTFADPLGLWADTPYTSLADDAFCLGMMYEDRRKLVADPWSLIIDVISTLLEILDYLGMMEDSSLVGGSGGAGESVNSYSEAGSSWYSQFGLHTGIGVGLVAIGWPFDIFYPRTPRMGGKTYGTSLISRFLWNILGRARFAQHYWAPTLAKPFAREALKSSVVARWVPVLGTAMLIGDVIGIAAYLLKDLWVTPLEDRGLLNWLN